MKWPEVALGDLVEFLDHRRKPVTAVDRVNGPYPYYGANGQQGTIDGYIFDEPLLLLAEDGGHFDDPSRGIAYTIDGPSWVNNHAHVLRMSPRLDLGFAHRILANLDVRKYVTGTTRAKLTKSGAAKITIPLPPLPEQRRIAAILDHADALRAKRRRVLAHLDDLKQSIFLDMFGDPVQDAASSRIGDICEIQIGPFGSLLHKEDYISGGVPLINPMHISCGSIDPDPEFSISPEKALSLTSYRLRTGDVVMGRRGEMGRCAVVDIDHDGYLCGTGSLIVRPKPGKSTAIYVQAALSHKSSKSRLERVALGSTLPNLNATIVKRFPLSAPSISSQEEFARRIRQLDLQRATAEHALAKTDTLFASLQSRAFRGEL